MKLPGYWVYCITIVALIFLLCPVHADEIDPTITHVFFEKDGTPYNESVYFTVECFGYTWKRWDGSDPEDLEAKVNHISEKGFSFSASCPSYGCTIYEPYYHAERMFVDHCDVRGQAAGMDFSIRNFSLTPVPNCTELRPFDFMKGGPEYFNGTPEYDACVNGTRAEQEKCDTYAAVCDPVTDTECQGWSINDRSVKETPAYRACMEEIQKKRDGCDAYLQRVDPSKIILWKDTVTGREEPARRACELRFEIPSQDTGNTTIPVQTLQNIPKSPVESLYCSILSLFGAQC